MELFGIFFILVSFTLLILYFIKEIAKLRVKIDLIKEREIVTIQKYRQWLSEFKDVSVVLDNLQKELKGEESLSIGPYGNGPWDISGLREILRKQRGV